MSNKNYDQILMEVSHRFMQDNSLTELMKDEVGDAFFIRENVNEIIMLYINYRLKSESPHYLLKALDQFNSKYGQLDFTNKIFLEIYERHCEEKIFNKIDRDINLYVNTPEQLFKIFDIMIFHRLFAFAKKLIINILDSKYSFLNPYISRHIVCMFGKNLCRVK